MVRRGYVRDNREAFDRYLDTDEYQRIERFKADARTCVETIKSAGGKVSLAHPYQIGLEDGPLEALVKELAGYGLDAVECYYPKHTPAQEAFYLRLAENTASMLPAAAISTGSVSSRTLRWPRWSWMWSG